MTNEDSARDAMWKMYEENVTQGRHHETQRTAVSSLLMAVVAGAIGLITFDKAITLADVPRTLLLVILGVFGALFSAKQYERFEMHMERARKYRDGLDQLLPDVDGLFPTTNAFRAELDQILADSVKPLPSKPIKFLKYAADREHAKRYSPVYRLHWFWIAFNVLVSILGVVLTVWAILYPQKVVCEPGSRLGLMASWEPRPGLRGAVNPGLEMSLGHPPEEPSGSPNHL